MGKHDRELKFLEESKKGRTPSENLGNRDRQRVIDKIAAELNQEVWDEKNK